jgi:type I restriction-modification system DNA methylase subunit
MAKSNYSASFLAEIRKKLVESGAVDVIVAVSNNFFYTVTLRAAK